MLRVVRYGSGIGARQHELGYVEVDPSDHDMTSLCVSYTFATRSHTGTKQELEKCTVVVNARSMQSALVLAVVERDITALEIAVRAERQGSISYAVSDAERCFRVPSLTNVHLPAGICQVEQRACSKRRICC